MLAIASISSFLENLIFLFLRFFLQEDLVGILLGLKFVIEISLSLLRHLMTVFDEGSGVFLP